VTKFPFKDAEQKRLYNQHYREQQKEVRESARIEMLRTVNETISKLFPSDVNGLLLIDTDLTFYKTFSDYRRDHPNASFPEFQDYQCDQKEWVFERKSERVEAVSKALEYLDGSEPKMREWRKTFPKFFEKWVQKKEEVEQS
jgi:hypothetical protein